MTRKIVLTKITSLYFDNTITRVIRAPTAIPQMKANHLFIRDFVDQILGDVREIQGCFDL